jgi:hypothetical protein
VAIDLQGVVFCLVEDVDLRNCDSRSGTEPERSVAGERAFTVLFVPMTIWRAETPEVPMMSKVPGVWASTTEAEDARETARAARRLCMVGLQTRDT